LFYVDVAYVFPLILQAFVLKYILFFLDELKNVLSMPLNQGPGVDIITSSISPHLNHIQIKKNDFL